MTSLWRVTFALTITLAGSDNEALLILLVESSCRSAILGQHVGQGGINYTSPEL